MSEPTDKEKSLYHIELAAGNLLRVMSPIDWSYIFSDQHNGGYHNTKAITEAMDWLKRELGWTSLTPPAAIEETEEKKTSGIPDAPSDNVEHVRHNAFLPCPFCGTSKAEPLTTLNVTDRHRWYVQCLNCGAQTNLFTTPNEANTTWNRRAASDPKGADSVSNGGSSNASGVSLTRPTVAAPPSSKSEEWTVEVTGGGIMATFVQLQRGQIVIARMAHYHSGDYGANERLLNVFSDAHNTSLSSLRSRCERLEREVASSKEKEA